MKNKIEFETYKEFSPYDVINLKRNEPSCVNFLTYKKFKVTIQPIEESNEVYLERLTKMLEKAEGWTQTQRITYEIEQLKKLLP